MTKQGRPAKLPHQWLREFFERIRKNNHLRDRAEFLQKLTRSIKRRQGADHFLKMRRSPFNEAGLQLPAHLRYTLGQERVQAMYYMAGQFTPGNVVQCADEAYVALLKPG